MKRLLTLFIMLLCTCSYGADIGEKELDIYRSAFIQKAIRDNPDREADIRSCLQGMIRQGGAGIRLMDKFGLFMYDSSSSGLLMERIRFIRDGKSSFFIIILKDRADSRMYSLFLEYIYSPADGSYSLGEIYFSGLFTERMNSVREFFGCD